MAKAKKSVSSVISVLTSVIKAAWRPLRRVLKIVLRPLRPVLRPALRYLRGVRQEFRQVSWPQRGLTWRLTLAVIGFAVIFAGFIASVDYGLNKLFEKIIIKG